MTWSHEHPVEEAEGSQEQATFTSSIEEEHRQVMAHVANLRASRPLVVSDQDKLWRVPFALLHLNRLDECFSFVRYVLNHTHDGETTRLEDWDVGVGARLGDILDYIPHRLNQNNAGCYAIDFLLAIFFLKVRMVKHVEHQVWASTLNVFLATTQGQTLGPLQYHFEDLILGEKRAGEQREHEAPLGQAYFTDLRGQKSQLRRIMDRIDRCNQSMLPALIHPWPLIKENAEFRLPELYFGGSPTQAYEGLIRGYRFISPDCPKLLAKRYGEKVEYWCGPFDCGPPEGFVMPRFDQDDDEEMSSG